MVDSLGVPMHGRTPFMDKNSAASAPPSIQFGVQATDSALSSVYGCGINVAPANAGVGASGGFGPTIESRPFNDAGFSATAASNAPTSIVANALSSSADGYDLVALAVTLGGNVTPDMSGKTHGGMLHRGADHVQGAVLAATADEGPVTDHLPYKNTQFARSAGLDTPVAVLGSGGAGSLRTAAVYTPSQWPDYQPSTLLGEYDDEEVDAILGKAKVSEYMKYLCNVRNLPIGVKGEVPITPLGYAGPTIKMLAAAQSATNVAANSYTQYRVSMPFLSGIYGIFAEKMFPDMLIGANNIRIEFKLAQNTKALWLTMDPCRRVPGTLRDFVPFTGAVPAAAGATARNVASVVAGALYTGLAKIPDANAGLGCGNAGVYFGLDFAGVSALLGTEMYNTESAMGEDLACPQFSVGVPAAGGLVLGQLKQSALLTGFHFQNVTNLPKPQWVPSATPWLKLPADNVSIVNENAACWGTYLPTSQAQVRRCQMSTRLNAVTDSFNNVGTTIFSIRDIQYIGEQVQLDDVVTSAIIQSAATSEIVVWTRGFRSFEAATDNATQQNIILPIQIGQAEALYLLFRPATITTSYDYYSNAFYCPFVGLTYEKTALTVTTLVGVAPQIPSTTIVYDTDVGGTYRLQSSLDSASQGQFSYQLFSGTKQYPLQPIQTVTEMITEREKSIHSLHNWDWPTTENMSMCRWGSKIGVLTAEQGLDYDPFIDFGYLTTFVPVYALDDQTITQNPYLQVAEARESDTNVPTLPRVRGVRYPTNVTTAATGVFTGVLNEFLSPIGSFYLGWDFESWTNHQDMMRTGKFLGQEQLSIRMTGTFLCSAQNMQTMGGQGQNANVMCIAIVPHVVKLSFVPGGHLLSYY